MAGTVQCDGAAAEAACTAPQAAAAACRRALSALTGWPMPPLAPSTATAWRSAAEELNMRGADGAAARSEERRAERASMVGQGWGMGGVRKIPRRPRSTPTAAQRGAGTRAEQAHGRAGAALALGGRRRALADALSARFAGCQPPPRAAPQRTQRHASAGRSLPLFAAQEGLPLLTAPRCFKFACPTRRNRTARMVCEDCVMARKLIVWPRCRRRRVRELKAGPELALRRAPSRLLVEDKAHARPSGISRWAQLKLRLQALRRACTRALRPARLGGPVFADSGAAHVGRSSPQRRSWTLLGARRSSG